MDSQPVDLTRFALVSDLYYSIDRRIYKALKVSIRYLLQSAYSPRILLTYCTKRLYSSGLPCGLRVPPGLVPVRCLKKARKLLSVRPRIGVISGPQRS